MGNRRKNDFYPTPQSLTLALLDHCHGIKHKRIYEPCNGKGAITNVLRHFGCTVVTGDIDPQMEADYHLDARYQWPTGLGVDGTPLCFDWIITNPPFKDSEKIWHNLRYDVQSLALLLRLSWLEPTDKRKDILKHNPPNHLLVLPRTSFTEDGKTDSVTCAWMVWDGTLDTSIRIYSKDDLHNLERNFLHNA